jgi:carboxyl-terminal processing protease
MLALLLASLMFAAPLAPPVAGDDLTAQIDQVLAGIQSGQEPSWQLSGKLRDLARQDELVAVPHLRSAADHAPDKTKVIVAETLVDLEAADKAAEILLPMVDGDSGADALAALANRAFLDVPDVAAALDQRLSQPQPGVRRVALAKALYRSSRASDDKNTAKLALYDAIKSEDADVRAEAAFALAELNDIGAAHDVLVALRDGDLGPRGRLARAFLRLEEANRAQDSRAERQSIKLTDSPDKGVGSLDVLEELIDKIQKNHLIGDEFASKEGREKLIDAAARGMLSALDPHSTFFTSKEFERWILDLRRNYAGIGAYVNTLGDPPVFTITRPIYGGPAYAAGLLSGDRVLEVDGWSTLEKPDDEIISRLKGTPGTPVKIKVLRDGWEEPQEKEIVRAVIHIPSVSSEMLPGGIGYTELAQFAEDTSTELAAAIDELKGQGMKGLIIDLRDNTGGYLEQAVSVASLFLPSGKLVCFTQGRTAERRDYDSESMSSHWDGPLIVLVNDRSASASEIVSGALQDHGRAVIVGEKTYGKGSVQQAMALDTRRGDPLTVDKNGNGIYDPGEDSYEDLDHNGQFTWPSEVKITNARYYLPSGRSIHTELDIDGKVIHEGGVTPDRVVAMDYMEPWENAELVRTFDRLRKAVPEGTTFKSPFTRYVEDHFDANKQLFYALADDDGRDPNRYPDFAAFKASLDTHLPDDTLRKLLRVSVRDRVQDDRGRLFVGINFRGDWQEDTQLQEGIRTVAEKASLDIAGIASYRFFAEAPKDAPKKAESPH